MKTPSRTPSARRHGPAARPSRAPAAALTLALAAVLALLPPASSRADTPLRFGETIEVRVIQVEVVVTDERGRRVPGLGPEDFVLRVDGRERPVDYFSEIRRGRVVEPVAPPQPDGSAPAPSADGGGAATGFLVFVDDRFSIGAHRDLVLRRLEEQLPSLRAGDRMAIVAYDGRGLEVLSPWTSSAANLSSALARARERPATGIFFRTGFLGTVGLRSAEAEDLARAAATALRGFASLPGRKVALLVAGGWPLFDRRPFHGEDGWSPYGPLVDTANLLGYTLYPIDAPGLGWNGPEVTDEAPRRPAISAERWNEAVLLHLAEATGGRAMLNANRDDALERAVADTGSYYWLGFDARRRADGRSHRLEVEVRRPGLEVRAREGFVDLTRASEIAASVEGRLLAPPAAGAGGELTLRAGPPRRLPRKKMEVPLRVGIPAGLVAAATGPDGAATELELRVAVRDARGTLSEVEVLAVEVEVPEPVPEDGLVPWETTITVWRERHEVVAALWDPLAGRLRTGSLTVEP